MTFLLIATIKLVKGDQPVHCLRENLYGVWDFHVTANPQTINLFDSREVCTHNIPNGLQFISKDYQFQFESDQVWRMNLQDGYKVQSMLCDNKITDKN